MNRLPDGAGVLHFLLSADQASWHACGACCAPGDTVLLLDRGVMGLARPSAIPQGMFPCHVAGSRADALARGLPIETNDLGVEFIDDGDVIALIEAHSHCLSWR